MKRSLSVPLSVLLFCCITEGWKGIPVQEPDLYRHVIILHKWQENVTRNYSVMTPEWYVGTGAIITPQLVLSLKFMVPKIQIQMIRGRYGLQVPVVPEDNFTNVIVFEFAFEHQHYSPSNIVPKYKSLLVLKMNKRYIYNEMIHNAMYLLTRQRYGFLHCEMVGWALDEENMVYNKMILPLDPDCCVKTFTSDEMCVEPYPIGSPCGIINPCKYMVNQGAVIMCDVSLEGFLFGDNDRGCKFPDIEDHPKAVIIGNDFELRDFMDDTLKVNNTAYAVFPDYDFNLDEPYNEIIVEPNDRDEEMMPHFAVAPKKKECSEAEKIEKKLILLGLSLFVFFTL